MTVLRLLVVDGPQAGESCPLRRGRRVVIGRSSTSDFQLLGGRVSREHAEVVWSPSGPAVADLASRNGTSLDQRPLKARVPQPIAPGQVLRIGCHTLLVERSRGSSGTHPPVVLDAPRVSERYRLRERLGRGSQATVWAAWDVAREREVAIKVLRGSPDADGEERERFLREGRIRCELDHPHLVRVYEFALPAHAPPYMVMERVRGTNAWALSRRSCLPVAKALELAVHLARALAAIAEVGIVHRDVKPTNLLVNEGGVGKLTDFGIAKVLDAPPLTQTGWGMGSLPFAAPEQARSAKAVTERTDVYGLGATLYTLLASRPPFEGDPSNAKGLRALLRAIETEVPPPLAPLRPDLPAGLADYVEQALLAKDPEERPPNARVALSRLEAFLRDCAPRCTTTGHLSETARE